ncbi:MAG: ATP synthase F1 subunit gamma [Wolbachia endosymbiont of Tyrophagus putrescentiae]|nr:ATP synthase F1 subunit gamma [Wolbachia endosymbiont of Tyrophagus putrescentiae]
MKSLKELSLRIKNIKSVQKTTKIMQMVSAAKLSKSQKKLLHSRLYISKLHNIISLVSNQELLAKIFNVRGKNSCLAFIISSDRGLCGNFNSSIVKFSREYIAMENSQVDVTFFGKKAFDISKNKLGSANVLKVENSKDITLEDVAGYIKILDLSVYSKVQIFYNKFHSTFSQKPTLETIKPWNGNSSLVDSSLASKAAYVYEYEPNDVEFFLRSLIEDYTVAALYSALLESTASENSARMVAMESANRNTKEMLNKLGLLYNRSRQAAITTDLIEVIGGAESL